MSAGECVMLLCCGALSVGELQESVSFLKIASNHHLLSSGGFICVLCCTTEVSAMPRSFVDRTIQVAVISEKDFLALCNSWSRLCSSNVFKEEILNLHRK